MNVSRSAIVRTGAIALALGGVALLLGLGSQLAEMWGETYPPKDVAIDRSLFADMEKIADVAQYSITEHHRLPQSLAEIETIEVEYSQLGQPKGRLSPSYSVIGPRHIRLCGDFALPSDRIGPDHIYYTQYPDLAFRREKAGRQCYEIDVLETGSLAQKALGRELDAADDYRIFHEPPDIRARSQDELTVARVSHIASDAYCASEVLHSTPESLPQAVATLTERRQEARSEGCQLMRSSEPESWNGIEYSRLDDASFRVCANFNGPTEPFVRIRGWIPLPLRQSRPSGGRFCYGFKTSELSPEFAEQEMARNDPDEPALPQPAEPPEPELPTQMPDKFILQH